MSDLVVRKNDDSILHTSAGVGLFVLTTVIFQWVQNQHRKDRDEERERKELYDDDGHYVDQQHRRRRQPQQEVYSQQQHQEEDLRHLYEQRRLRDRLSYEDLSKVPIANGHSEQRTYQENQQGGNQYVNNGMETTTTATIFTDNKNRTVDGPSSPNASWDIDDSIDVHDYGMTTMKPPTEWNTYQSQRRMHGSQNCLTLFDGHDSVRGSTRTQQSSTSRNCYGGIITTTTTGTKNGKINHPVITISGGGKDHYVGEMMTHPNALYDFHPKNRNWRHFEHYNERDRQRNEQMKAARLAASTPKNAREEGNAIEMGDRESNLDTSMSQNHDMVGTAVSEPHHQPPPRQIGWREDSIDEQKNEETDDRRSCIFVATDSQELDDNDNDNDDDDDNDGRSISSSSMSSEEQFVWTKHQHRGSSSVSSSVPATTERVSDRVNTMMMRGNNTDDTGSDRPLMQQSLNHISLSSTSDMAATNTLPSSSDDNKSAEQTTTAVVASSHLQKPYNLVKRMLSLGSAVGESEIGTNDQSSRARSISQHGPVRPRQLSKSSSEVHNRTLRAEYNARIMPEKLVLIRHGQSMGNINEALYSTTPDNSIPLTDLGWEEARRAGMILKEKILNPNESVHFVVSPYVRTVETFHGLASAWCDPNCDEFASITNHDERVKAWYGRLMEMGLTWNEDSRVREQDFGNYQKPEVIKRAKEERHRFGSFYYRFPHGESASDVFDRVSTFLDSLWRSFEMNKSRNYVLVTHGIVLRVFLARYFRYTIDQFNMLANPRNCEMVVLGHAGEGKLDLEGRCTLDVEEEPETQQSHVTGYKFHKRLRILPKNAIRKVKIRISPTD